MMDTVYTITMLKDKENISDKRLVAICTSMQIAIDIVEANESDIQEGMYNLAVIEEVNANSTYGIPVSIPVYNQVWFEWNEEQFVAVEAPRGFARIINFWG
jgi:hypothetical protein